MSISKHKPVIFLVTPALHDANNGNWQTAQRWARMLAGKYTVRVQLFWAGEQADVLIALHARRSAGSIDAWARTVPKRPLVVVMTGTDLYRDIATDVDAQRSLQRADRLIVLQELGGLALPESVRGKSVVCFQSAPAQQARIKTKRHLRALMVGHLREVKSPQTFFSVARTLRQRDDLRFDHIGAALDPALGEVAAALARECPHYRWLGALSHHETRERISRAHVLVHTSRLEGGAHVVLEAVNSGTPVLASRIDGNVGMLGVDYAGYFDWDDRAALSSLLQRCRDDEAFFQHLRQQCAARAPLFAPAREKSTLLAIVAECLSAV